MITGSKLHPSNQQPVSLKKKKPKLDHQISPSSQKYKDQMNALQQNQKNYKQLQKKRRECAKQRTKDGQHIKKQIKKKLNLTPADFSKRSKQSAKYNTDGNLKQSSKRSDNKIKIEPYLGQIQNNTFQTSPQIKKDQYKSQLQKNKQKFEQQENTNNIFQIKINSLQSEVRQLRQQNLIIKNIVQTLRVQFDTMKAKLQKYSIPLEIQVDNEEYQTNNRSIAFFPGDVLDGCQDYKDFLTQVLQRAVGRSIIKTKLLFKHDKINKNCNIHDYIDGKEHIILLAKTKLGYHFGGYYDGRLQDKGANSGIGLIMSITNRQCYKLKPEKRPVIYDRYFLIFGNSDLRVNAGDPKVASNFGTINCNYENRDDRVDALFGEGTKRQVELQFYEVHQVIFR